VENPIKMDDDWGTSMDWKPPYGRNNTKPAILLMIIEDRTYH
jgi:hypothetical protein